RCASAPRPGVVVPFEFVKQQVVLTARAGGSGPFRLLLDTAVDPSVIDLAVARSIGAPLAAGPGGEVQGVGSGRTRARASAIPDLELGGVPFGTVEALANDMSRLSARLGLPLHGVLGYSFLRSRVVTIDYPARVVYVDAEAQRPSRSPSR